MTAWYNHGIAQDCDICRYCSTQLESTLYQLPNQFTTSLYPVPVTQSLPFIPIDYFGNFQITGTGQATQEILPTYLPPSYPPPSYLATVASNHPPSINQFQIEVQGILYRCYSGDSEESIRLRGLLNECLGSSWYLEQLPEPHGSLDAFARKVSEYEFACSVYGCEDSRDRLSRLVNHLRVHINHRPHSCPQNGGCHIPSCSSRFCTQEALNAHQRIPTRKKRCSNCGQFMDSKNMKRHLESQRCKKHASGSSYLGHGFRLEQE